MNSVKSFKNTENNREDIFSPCLTPILLFNYLESLCLLCEEHGGFRKGYGTIDHIFNLKCLIDLYLFRRNKLYCAFIYYRKAFDSVDRILLWQKLLRTSIDGNVK
jgi:hypothetical protein